VVEPAGPEAGTSVAVRACADDATSRTHAAAATLEIPFWRARDGTKLATSDARRPRWRA